MWRRRLEGPAARAWTVWPLVVAAASSPCSVARLTAQETVLVAVGEEWRYFKGRSEPSPDAVTGAATTAWTELDFDDAGWLVGATGIGYSDNDDRTVLADMRNGYLSLYARKRFVVEEPAAVRILELSIDYDDGFVAYLNGFEAARSNVQGTPPGFNSAAAGNHEAGTAEKFQIDAGLLAQGDNVLAVQVHNTSLGSSDLSFVPQLVANPDVCPTAGSLDCVYDFGELTVELSWTNETVYDRIDIIRNGELLDQVTGDTETYTDFTPLVGEEAVYAIIAVLLGEECAPLECAVFSTSPEDLLIRQGDTWAFLRGDAPPPADWFEPEFDDSSWDTGPTGIGYGDGDDVTLLDDMQMVAGVQPGYLSVFCRRFFEIDDLDSVREVTLSILYDDGVVVYLNGEELGRANMPAGAVTNTTAASGAAPEPSFFEATVAPDLLSEGENLLAVSVHNTNLTSSDLSFIPVLVRVPDAAFDENLFIRGDVFSDDRINLTDAIALLDHLFRSQPPPACLDSADIDDSGNLNLTDPIALLDHLFRGQPPPAAPGLECGVDPSPDDLGECPSPACLTR